VTYTIFTEVSDTGKTKVWSVDNSDNGSHIGVVKWRGGWRKYALFPESDTLWSADCLRDVANFIDARMKERRK
jgi:hypothetical protein